MDIIIYQCWDLYWNMLVKAPIGRSWCTGSHTSVDDLLSVGLAWQKYIWGSPKRVDNSWKRTNNSPKWSKNSAIWITIRQNEASNSPKRSRKSPKWTVSPQRQPEKPWRKTDAKTLTGTAVNMYKFCTGMILSFIKFITETSLDDTLPHAPILPLKLKVNVYAYSYLMHLCIATTIRFKVCRLTGLLPDM